LQRAATNAASLEQMLVDRMKHVLFKHHRSDPFIVAADE